MRHLSAFLSVSFAVTALAGCSNGGNVTSIPPPGNAIGKPATTNYQLLYSFGSVPHDGAGPIAGLINRQGVLYGTTANGGKTTCGTAFYGCGTVFSVTTTGTETVLHRFGLGYGDTAVHPYAGLVALNSVLYGTTAISGPCSGTYLSCGTVYSIGRYGAYSVLHSFTGAPSDGSAASAPLVVHSGLLYGTTYTGGTQNAGTVFSISPSGTETLLYSFTGGSSDGANPASNLVFVSGVFYGTTAFGGAHNQGVVFSITPGGTEAVLHSFGGSGDGTVPQAGLVAVKGVLYGTTSAGGAGPCFYSSLSGCGTVFSITPGPSGTEAVLHAFGGSDGANPLAGLIVKNGVLYGTTLGGGSGSCNVNGALGCGTVFSVTRGGAETVLHDFGSSGDGTSPAAPLMVLNGVLYGTTELGGTNNAGTVFSLTP